MPARGSARIFVFLGDGRRGLGHRLEKSVPLSREVFVLELKNLEASPEKSAAYLKFAAEENRAGVGRMRGW